MPDFLSLYPQAQQVAPFAGMDRPLCDRKQVVLNDQMQTSATFFVFTEVPVASNNTGIILDDATSEFNAAAPDFGEKASVPFVPVSIKDFAGLEISRTYSDQWGAYNMMTPSSWLVNPPTPSGYGPNMLVTCINDPGPIPDPVTGQLITDPHYNPAYSNFCYTNPFMPGQTTYLDTPVLPIAAFAAGYNPADCALPDASPVIKRVDSSAGFGPWLPADRRDPDHHRPGRPAGAQPGLRRPVRHLRPRQPAHHHPPLRLRRHARAGSSIGSVDLTGSVTSWNDGVHHRQRPGRHAHPGELVITTAGGQASVDTVTVTVGGPDADARAGQRRQKIQDAIDAGQPG